MSNSCLKRCGPILGTHLHPSLLTPTQHHHHTTLPLIDHLHKVPHSVLHWTLSYDETFLLLVALSLNYSKRHEKGNHNADLYIFKPRHYFEAYIGKRGIYIAVDVTFEHHSPLISCMNINVCGCCRGRTERLLYCYVCIVMMLYCLY